MQRAIDIDPGDEMGYFLMGQLLANHGRTDEAAASFRRALEIRPDFEDARGRLQSLSRAGRSGAGSLVEEDE